MSRPSASNAGEPAVGAVRERSVGVVPEIVHRAGSIPDGEQCTRAAAPPRVARGTLRIVGPPVAVLVDAVAVLPTRWRDSPIRVIAVATVVDRARGALANSPGHRRRATEPVAVIVGETRDFSNVFVDRRGGLPTTPEGAVAVVVGTIESFGAVGTGERITVIAIRPRGGHLNDGGGTTHHAARLEAIAGMRRAIAILIGTDEVSVDGVGVRAGRQPSVAVIVHAVAVAPLLRTRVDVRAGVVAVALLLGVAIAVVIERGQTHGRERRRLLSTHRAVDVTEVDEVRVGEGIAQGDAPPAELGHNLLEEQPLIAVDAIVARGDAGGGQRQEGHQEGPIGHVVHVPCLTTMPNPGWA